MKERREVVCSFWGPTMKDNCELMLMLMVHVTTLHSLASSVTFQSFCFLRTNE